MMTFRFIVSTDGGTTYTQVVKPGVSKPLFAWDVDPNTPRLSKRLILQSALLFGGQTNRADYDYFRSLDQVGEHCTALFIQFQIKCAGEWEVAWTGRFPAGGGRWDHDACTWSIKPDVIDVYSCLLSRQDVKKNILNTEIVNVNVVNFPSSVQIRFGIGGPAEVTFGAWTDTGDAQTLTYPSGMGACTGTTTTQNIYWREIAVTDCVGGNPVEPPGSGWIALGDSFGGFTGGNFGCDDFGQVRWARPPVAAWPFPADPLVVGPSGGAEPSSPPCTNWYRVSTLNCVGGHVAGIFVCLEQATSSAAIDTARTLRSAIEYLIEQTGCELLGVRSDFFEWDAPGDAPGYSAGINYVTGTTNQVDNLLILQKSDVIDPTASNPATIGEMSFKEMMEALRIMFRVHWDIDDEGYVRIEHFKYWKTQPGLDLTAMTNAHEGMNYEALTQETPRVERALWAEALGRDFVGRDIIYSGACVSDENGKGVEEVSPGNITTDVSFILSDPTAISKRGFVIMATSFNGADYDCIVDLGAISGTPTTNAPLSWANLQRDFWTWDRYLPEGNMNGADVTFDGFRPTVQQGQAIVTCHACELLNFSPENLITTRLGETYLNSAKGVVERAAFDTEGHLFLTLRYSR